MRRALFVCVESGITACLLMVAALFFEPVRGPGAGVEAGFVRHGLYEVSAFLMVANVVAVPILAWRFERNRWLRLEAFVFHFGFVLFWVLMVWAMSKFICA